MKRREFLAASAVAPLLASWPAHAVKQQPAKKAATTKPVNKTLVKKTPVKPTAAKTPLPVAEAEEIKQREKAYSQQLQREGKWRHIWRVAGLYANVSIFDVKDTEELHQILMGLPLYPFMDIRVEALCRHPSSVRDDDS